MKEFLGDEGTFMYMDGFIDVAKGILIFGEANIPGIESKYERLK